MVICDASLPSCRLAYFLGVLTSLHLVSAAPALSVLACPLHSARVLLSRLSIPRAAERAQDGESVISDSVIFVRNPACNNFHGTSSGAAPSLLPDLDPIQVSLMRRESSLSANCITNASHELHPITCLSPLRPILLWCPSPLPLNHA